MFQLKRGLGISIPVGFDECSHFKVTTLEEVPFANLKDETKTIIRKGKITFFMLSI